jgi:hypothetical protein
LNDIVSEEGQESGELAGKFIGEELRRASGRAPGRKEAKRSSTGVAGGWLCRVEDARGAKAAMRRSREVADSCFAVACLIRLLQHV